MFDKLFNAMKNSKNTKNSCCAIIVAAGNAQRMNSAINKQFLEISDKPILAYTLEVFDCCSAIDEVIVVAKSTEIVDVANLVSEYKIKKVKNIICGGDTRQASVYAGLMAVTDHEFVAIHDGARPFVKCETIEKVVNSAYQYSSAAVGVRVTDTIKRCDKDGFILETVDRTPLIAIQTPQVFNKNIIIGAHKYAMDNNLQITDDCMAIEAIGGKIKLVEGYYTNIKITTQSDLLVGEAILCEEEK